MQGTLDFSYWLLHYCGKTYHDDLILLVLFLGSHAKGRGVTLQRQSHSFQVPVFPPRLQSSPHRLILICRHDYAKQQD